MLLKFLFVLWLLLAGIPRELWHEYRAVAVCESNMRTDALGDGGRAKGIMQIHYDLWQQWALDESLIDYESDWTNPIHNIQLAYIIQEKYSIPRHRDRWEQWSAKPYFNC